MLKNIANLMKLNKNIIVNTNGIRMSSQLFYNLVIIMIKLTSK